MCWREEEVGGWDAEVGSQTHSDTYRNRSIKSAYKNPSVTYSSWGNLGEVQTTLLPRVSSRTPVGQCGIWGCDCLRKSGMLVAVPSSSLNPSCPKSKTVSIQLTEPILGISANILCYFRMLLDALALIFCNLAKCSLYIEYSPWAEFWFFILLCLQKCFGAPYRWLCQTDAQRRI